MYRPTREHMRTQARSYYGARKQTQMPPTSTGGRTIAAMLAIGAAIATAAGVLG